MLLKKIWIRFFNNSEYRQIKNEEIIKESAKIFIKNYSPEIKKIQRKINEKENLNFLHSGHAADIINVLPVIKKLSEKHSINLYINIKKPIKHYYKHPAGKYYLDKRIYDLLEPLLKEQSYINRIKVYENEELPRVNLLDLIRELPINLTFDNARYASLLTSVYPDLSLSFLECGQHQKFRGYVAIQRTFRYRNHFIDYSFLNNYKKLLFIGIENEYQDLKKL